MIRGLAVQCGSSSGNQEHGLGHGQGRTGGQARGRVGITQPVTGRGTKAEAEYKFNDKARVRAQWDNQSQDSSVGNPGVEDAGASVGFHGMAGL